MLEVVPADLQVRHGPRSSYYKRVCGVALWLLHMLFVAIEALLCNLRLSYEWQRSPVESRAEAWPVASQAKIAFCSYDAKE